MGDLIWSFSPWVLFLLATRFTSLTGAIALGLVAALVVAARAIGHHHLHLLDVAKWGAAGGATPGTGSGGGAEPTTPPLR